MPEEIERKFLVTAQLGAILHTCPNRRHLDIEQRYLEKNGEWTTRIRKTVVNGTTEHWLTFKRKLNSVKCTEIESPISENFYTQISEQCGPPLTKVRYELHYPGHKWELDIFSHPVFEGLMIAEIELKHEDEAFDIPHWVGREVTHEPQYKNAKMAKRLRLITS